MVSDTEIYRVKKAMKIPIKRLQTLQFEKVNGVWELDLKQPKCSITYDRGEIEIYSTGISTLYHICMKLKIRITSVVVEHMISIEKEDGISFRRFETIKCVKTGDIICIEE